jgi:GH25 family lysozyme M1 (1,4-beta-N-acetylmuramidase)
MAGIDISVYQGDVDFETARDDGVEVVYIRASYGSDGVDSALYSHYEGARAAGRKLGFYHYLTALDTESAQAQAGFFAGLIRDLDYDCRPAWTSRSTGVWTGTRPLRWPPPFWRPWRTSWTSPLCSMPTPMWPPPALPAL